MDGNDSKVFIIFYEFLLTFTKNYGIVIKVMNLESKYCKNGHELTDKNSRVHKSGALSCYTCHNILRREKYWCAKNGVPYVRKVTGPEPKTHCINGHELTPENTKQMFNKNGAKDGRKCIICKAEISARYYQRNPETVRKAGRDRYHNNPDKFRERHIKKAYGITLNDYNVMLETQDGKCAICGSTEPCSNNKSFAVDHCHASGKVRSLLCSRCNLTLGAVNDEPELLNKMIEYLNLHSNS